MIGDSNWNLENRLSEMKNMVMDVQYPNAMPNGKMLNLALNNI
jgi:hypothetical protein